MSDLRERDWEDIDNVSAILVSDVHLSHTAPALRSTEPDWYEAMERTMVQLRELSTFFECPTIIAGDIFDKWNAPAQTINFALHSLPDRVYAIPGQHDLPNHSYNLKERSAYWTLVKAGKIVELTPELKVVGPKLFVRGFPWGFKIKPWEEEMKRHLIYLTVAHQYVWFGPHKYPGAPKGQALSSLDLDTEDVMHFGDNHKGFSKIVQGTRVFNGGTLMRRTAHDIHYEPMVGLLLENGYVHPIKLDIEDDQYIDIEEAMHVMERALDMTDFVGALSQLALDSNDFLETVKRFCDRNNVAETVRTKVMEAVSGKEHTH